MYLELFGACGFSLWGIDRFRAIVYRCRPQAGGCAFTYKAGAGSIPAIPFVSPHADGEWDRSNATIGGAGWHLKFDGK